jgi:hypothetical protein
VTALIKPLDGGVTAISTETCWWNQLPQNVLEQALFVRWHIWGIICLEYDKASYHYLVTDRILSDHKIYCCMGIQEKDISTAILQNTERHERIYSENT